MRAPFVPALTSRGQDSRGLSRLPPPGTAAAQTVKGQLFLISNLAAWAKALKRVIKRKKKMGRCLERLILWINKRLAIRFSGLVLC